ncbi:hypothetical protein [Paraburkholderia sp. BR10954]|uniref:hypothetical protein n=1 Tax=Paraburkholderia sp. BR10954 TaxID=3236995 RepID=UPI0034D33D2B
MNLENDPRILVLRDALEDEVHGLWISFEMAVKVLIVAALAMSACLYGIAGACTIGEEAEIELPFNKTELTNANRLAVADAVIEAKKWPDVQIQAVIMSGAYTVERNIDRLKEGRARNVKAHLQQLGISSENILIERHTFTDEMVGT